MRIRAILLIAALYSAPVCAQQTGKTECRSLDGSINLLVQMKSSCRQALVIRFAEPSKQRPQLKWRPKLKPLLSRKYLSRGRSHGSNTHSG